MEGHRRILEIAARGEMPHEIDERSELSVDVVRELVDAGYLDAIDASSMDGEAYIRARITLAGREYLEKLRSQPPSPLNDLLELLDRMRDKMIAVATGGPRIDDVNGDYRQLYAEADQRLKELGIEHANPFPDLWDWYGRWRSGDLPSYQSRREFLAEVFNPMLQQVRDVAAGLAPRIHEPTGWSRVDRTIGEARRRLAEARTEEQFQGVGHLCRETLISLAQAVYRSERHPPLDETTPSETDAKRMLDAFIAVELPGSSAANARRHARAALALADDLQHRRTATFRDGALCVEATSSVVNVIAIVSGKRDP